MIDLSNERSIILQFFTEQILALTRKEDFMNTYTTIQGQTWDIIALEVYRSEFYAGYLMSQNGKALNYFIFPEGVILNIPELPESEATVEQPDWRSE